MGAVEDTTTSGIGFTVFNRCSAVRLGPLAYITSDIEEGVTKKNNSHHFGPMEHRMCIGEYRVHRVAAVNDVGRRSLFTVIALKDLDPRKIVDSLRDFTAITEKAARRDMFFDNRRWMQFAGKKAPIIDDVQLHHLQRRRNDPGSIVYSFDSPYRDSIRERLAIAAYTCMLNWSRKMSVTGQSVVKKSDMVCGDRNTFYIRFLSRRIVDELRVELSSPDMSVFTASCGRSKKPSLIGIYHDDGLGRGVCGYVMYTKTDVEGNPMASERVFAVVLGSTFLSGAVVGDFGDATTFGHCVPCCDFLYGGKTEDAGKTTPHRKRKYPADMEEEEAEYTVGGKCRRAYGGGHRDWVTYRPVPVKDCRPYTTEDDPIRYVPDQDSSSDAEDFISSINDMASELEIPRLGQEAVQPPTTTAGIYGRNVAFCFTPEPRLEDISIEDLDWDPWLSDFNICGLDDVSLSDVNKRLLLLEETTTSDTGGIFDAAAAETGTDGGQVVYGDPWISDCCSLRLDNDASMFGGGVHIRTEEKTASEYYYEDETSLDFEAASSPNHVEHYDRTTGDLERFLADFDPHHLDKNIDEALADVLQLGSTRAPHFNHFDCITCT